MKLLLSDLGLLEDLLWANETQRKSSLGDLFDKWPAPTSNWWFQILETTPITAGFKVRPFSEGGHHFSAPQFNRILRLELEGFLRAEAQETREQISGMGGMDLCTHRYFVTDKGKEVLRNYLETGEL